ncbi:NAD(P)/FAD-dependent oxidoreductase [Polaromonas sp. SM01]|uniref:NAD(P)/FAD-dependent oxidoreductase n=1 Tax=Polaromonas sp. SM01 TaxID=3085630 RepID=UPI002980E094|nr:NAD(P)/FAD-dependent oxidoreductase [Polaromonas sp. SM01]MDW5444015.1 NAD(P)/FAD-dependent oxidoreductase [Polaromonas sp. SM01]
MIRLNELKLPLDHADDALPLLIAKTLGIASGDLLSHSIYKRSYDARKQKLLLVYIVDVELAPTLVASRTALPPEGANFPRGGPSRNVSTLEAELLVKFAGNPHIRPSPDQAYYPVAQADPAPAVRPVVVGFGPCGIFAALLLAQMGFKPIVLERGKKVRERTKDTWGLWRKKILNPESNVQFGEGGAGTFSDGKLYSQIKDPRHLGRKVMTEFVKAGAPPEILLVSKPHIGTFKLVKVVEHMREQIIALGGEVRFEQRVSDVLIEDGQMRGLTVQNLNDGTNYELRADHVVLALGHSSRDTVTMLHERGVYMEAKPFSVGFRIEHPQGLIDRARLGQHAGHPLLGAADYKLVHHASNGRSVYSFCMCPGGTVVAATSEVNRVVTNGMSQYSRNERNANAGIVVGITPGDYPGGPLAGIEFQRQLESHAFTLGGSNYEAPGQLVGDFVAGQASTQLGSVEPSYKPGVLMTDLASALPDYAITAMREAIPAFGKKIRGFDMHDAVLTGVETRTSSPLKMTRGDNFQSLNVKGLYPAGEGASYAGGILSAGVDGIEVAEAVARSITGAA